jgi:hypothetical protein
VWDIFKPYNDSIIKLKASLENFSELIGDTLNQFIKHEQTKDANEYLQALSILRKLDKYLNNNVLRRLTEPINLS